MHELLVYEHCPHCCKARMIFGFKNLPVRITHMANDDEATPIALIGAKQAPILIKPDGSAMPESMDIIALIDQQDGHPLISTAETPAALESWLKDIAPLVYKLAMPRFIHQQPPFAEFAEQSARDYFQHKKEPMLKADFPSLLAQSESLKAEVNSRLAALPDLITGPFVQDQLSLADFHLYGTLHSLSIVEGLHYPEKLERYRRELERQSRMPLPRPVPESALQTVAS